MRTRKPSPRPPFVLPAVAAVGGILIGLAAGAAIFREDTTPKRTTARTKAAETVAALDNPGATVVGAAATPTALPAGVEGARSLFYFPTRDELDTDEDTRLGGHLAMRCITEGDASSCEQAIDLFKELEERRSFGTEYGALRWVCTYLRAEPSLRDALTDPDAKRFLRLFQPDDWLALRAYVANRFGMRDELKKLVPVLIEKRGAEVVADTPPPSEAPTGAPPPPTAAPPDGEPAPAGPMGQNLQEIPATGTVLDATKSKGPATKAAAAAEAAKTAPAAEAAKPTPTPADGEKKKRKKDEKTAEESGGSGQGSGLGRAAEYLHFLTGAVRDLNPTRPQWEKSDDVVRLLALQPGEVVADVGAGAGHFTFRLAHAVGAGGKVHALDYNAKNVAWLKATAEDEGYANVEVEDAKAEGLGLEPHSVDLVFMAGTYAAIYGHTPRDERAALIDALKKALKPGGRLALLEATPEDELPAGAPPMAGDAISASLVVAQLEAWGFKTVERKPLAPQRYLLVMELPAT